jgi:hypothetical protein
MITIRYCKAIESDPFSRDGMDEDTVTIGEEEIEFDITFEQAAEYFAPRDYSKWTMEKQDGFIEGIKEIYYMGGLDVIIEDEDFVSWAYENFYEEY